MNVDIRLSVLFFDHPKTVKLKRKLGLEGVESLIRLWSWAALNMSEGDIGDDADDIEISARWNGEPGAFIDALVALRWVDVDEGRYALLKGSVTKNLPMEKLDDAVKYYGPWELIIEASNGHLAFGQFGMIEIAGRFK